MINISNKEISLLNTERVSASEASFRSENKRKTASVTIEASFAIPLFLFAALCLIWLVEMQSIKVTIMNAAHNAAKAAAEDTAVIPVLNTVKLKADMIDLIGEERIHRSIIEGGTDGISCFRSYVSPGTGEMNINIKYKIRLPIPVLGNMSAERTEKFKISAWTGCRENLGRENDGSIVYVADNGVVYHEDYQCSYLQLSVRFIPYEQIESIRNLGGGIYYPCEKCVFGSAMTGVYVTEQGGRYHNSLNCSGLKRTIRAVEKSDVSWLGGCSRCSHQE